MKLFGSRKKSRHAAGSGGKRQSSTPKGTGTKKKSKPKKKVNIFIKIIVIIIAIAVALAVAAFAYWKTSVKPPDILSARKPGGNTESTDTGEGEEAPSLPTDDVSTVDRSGEKYTFAVLGLDDGNGNTDTIMAGTFDTNNYTLDIVSIPRDTLVNVSWSVKKANTLYSYGGIDGAVSGLADLLGYEVDFYAIIDLNAFEKLVDAVGGITYDVPQNMQYSDPVQDLYIDLKAGTQTLNGEQAMWVMRFRSDYAAGDIKRIEVQQDFLKTAVSQILANTSDIPVTTLADIVINDVETNLTYGNIIWFAKELFKMDAENVNFHTIPGDTNDSIYQGTQWVSYVTIYVDEWLEMINEYLNPYDEPITESDLDILTRNSSGALYATSGVRQGSSTWGSSSGSSTSKTTTTTTPAPSTSTPTTTPSTSEPSSSESNTGESTSNNTSGNNSEPVTPPDDQNGDDTEQSGNEGEPADEPIIETEDESSESNYESESEVSPESPSENTASEPEAPTQSSDSPSDGDGAGEDE